jgi:hypothetical protein
VLSVDSQLRELRERYCETDRRTRPDNPRDIVLLKVQEGRWVDGLLKSGRTKAEAERYPTVVQLRRLIREWYREHPEYRTRWGRTHRSR